MALTKRENALAVMNRNNPEWLVYYLSYGHNPQQRKIYEDNIEITDSLRHHQFPLSRVNIPYEAKKDKPDFSKYYVGVDLPENVRMSEMGIAISPGTFHHYVRQYRPMRDFTSAKEVEEYPWPEEPPYDDAYNEAMKKAVEEIKAQGRLSLVHVGSIFEQAWQLRGMENMFSDFVFNEDLATVLLDEITGRYIRMARAAGMAGADMIFTADDLGTQSKMLMSPGMWRKWLKPRLASVTAAAREHKPDIHVKYHSDGYFDPLIPELIEAGITILNPVQPESTDPVRLKKLYGDKLTFDGTIGIQTTMPFGTPEDVHDEVKRMIEIVGEGGGLIITARHTLEPGVPVENVQAFLDAVDRYGHYV